MIHLNRRQYTFGTHSLNRGVSSACHVAKEHALSDEQDNQYNPLIGVPLGAVDQAFGLLPSGQYLMTAAHAGHRSGLVVGSLVRCCDEPALVCVSARKGHRIDSLIRDSRSFAVGIMTPGDKMIARKFKKSSSIPPGLHQPIEDDPFDGLETQVLETGSPMLMRCRTWFDCEVMRRVDLESDTELFVGLVVGVFHEGQWVKIEQKLDLEEHR